MKNLEKRLEALEARHSTTGPECVKILIVRPGPDGPVNDPVDGWELTGGEQIMRHPGESDNDLQARAIAESRQSNPGGLPVLLAVTAETKTEEV